MERRALGQSGLKVSAVGLGCNNFGMAIDEAQSAEVVSAAIDNGIDFFDTADMYSDGNSEVYLGKALGKRRNQVCIATKFGSAMGDSLDLAGGASRRYILLAVEASLKRLKTDYIDLYQLHMPDPSTPIEETIAALEDLQQQGKIRYYGHSNFSGWQTVEAALLCRDRSATQFLTAQNGYSLLSRQIERELVPACEKYGVSILPYFPLESGLLTGKYKAERTPEPGTRRALWAGRNNAFINAMFAKDRFDAVQAFQTLCNDFGCTLLELAFGWLLAQKSVGSVIAGATRGDQIKSNAEAAAWRPTLEQCARVDELAVNLNLV